MRLFTALILSLLFTATVAQAKVVLEVLEPWQGLVRLTYTFPDADSGSTGFVFPPAGFDFTKGQVKLVEVVDEVSGKALAAEVVTIPDHPDRQGVAVHYPAPLKLGNFPDLRIVLEAQTDLVTVDNGVCRVSFPTSHDLAYLLPQGHALVESSVPVLVSEENGRVKAAPEGLQERLRTIRTYVFQSRPVD
jgi:hypothetical protein